MSDVPGGEGISCEMYWEQVFKKMGQNIFIKRKGAFAPFLFMYVRAKTVYGSGCLQTVCPAGRNAGIAHR